MTKAEEVAMKEFPNYSPDGKIQVDMSSYRFACERGYEQAEKEIKSLLIKKIRKTAIWNTIKVGKKEIRDIVTEIIESI